MKHIVDLIAQAVQRCPDDVVLVASPGQSNDGAPGVLVPVGSAQPGKGRHHIAAVGVPDLAGHVFRVPGFLQQLQFVPQPLDGSPRHKDGAFQRIVHLAVDAPCNGGDQPVPGEHRGLSGVHQHKAAGAKGVLGFPGG